MTREDAKELLPIIQAYAEGKTIQMKDSSDDCWHDIIGLIKFYDKPDIYRVKPDEVFRPYKDCDEMIADFKKRFSVTVPFCTIPSIWVKSNNDKEFITGVDDNYVRVNVTWYTLDDLFEDYTYLDGSPCGVKE